MKFIICLLVQLFFLKSVLGAEKTICTITSDIDSNSAQIMAEVNDQTGLITRMYENTFENGHPLKTIEIRQEDLKNGVVLDSEGSRITVLLRSDNFDFNYGGELVLDTLYNGITGKRQSFSISGHLNDGNVVLMYKEQPFSKIHAIANRSVVFGVIGIEKLIFQN